MYKRQVAGIEPRRLASTHSEIPGAGRGTDVSTCSNTVDPAAGSRQRPTLPTLKLGIYDGTTPLETFLAKFENYSDYYSWVPSLCHVRASLEKDAGQALWDADTHSTVDELITLIRNRFGSANQCERYRTELKVLRRRRGDTLQIIYREVRRLMTLAFPGQSGILWEAMARDAFVEALGDPDGAFWG